MKNAMKQALVFGLPMDLVCVAIFIILGKNYLFLDLIFSTMGLVVIKMLGYAHYDDLELHEYLIFGCYTCLIMLLTIR
ncbi:hypothetical protein SAMN05216392_0785 [Streptococcus equinus]|uniref:Uncharacterized protein n=1 Tax=Streptococcus equinus TaxID=1335 RepID=A0A1H0YP89_STREI|nr:hypothetical protein [Streptococcus equinus]SDQ16973.1 hypothetical protein SAMN05216392_0785 [Streptococcus equinus]